MTLTGSAESQLWPVPCLTILSQLNEDRVMRTNIELNEDLVAEAQRLTGFRTKRGLIDHALRELVRRRQQRRLLELRGRVKWEGDLGRMRCN